MSNWDLYFNNDNLPPGYKDPGIEVIINTKGDPEIQGESWGSRKRRDFMERGETIDISYEDVTDNNT